MQAWQPIETAAKNKPVILYQPEPFNVETVSESGVHHRATYSAGVYTGHWDAIHSAWCIGGGTWLGPFLKPTHWMPQPLDPVAV